ncbi:unnamed protein product [Leptidea sinapis]|uniref:Uncharacterized protein n=1 Tax=Leptidea sinapis TaxID=189913 RepID=A0A5E4QM82_9NEOP|nr:unnamed protein product [Leptidea sinapis]
MATATERWSNGAIASRTSICWSILSLATLKYRIWTRYTRARRP